MKVQLVQNAALSRLEQFKTHGTLGAEKIKLIEPAAQGQMNRLRDQFSSTIAADQGESDLNGATGVVHTFRGPTAQESVERSLETKSVFSGDASEGEISSHQLATLKSDDEPYQESYEFTQFRSDGISHVTITILGDAVGTGGIVSMAEFLSDQPGQSWRERHQEDFIGADIIGMYQAGTYTPRV